MKRLQYFNTREGQIHLRFRRSLDTVYIHVLQQPLSKNAMHHTDKVIFQQEVLRQLTSQKRRPFRSDIILELTFFITGKNPPSIHTLAKNYLDLLGKPLSKSGINRSGLLYADDRQVKLLIVNCHFGTITAEPSVWIKASRLSHFVSDLRLLDKIRTDSFEESETDRYGMRSGFQFDSDKVNDLYDSIEQYSEELSDVVNDRGSWVKSFGQAAFDSIRRHLAQSIQMKYLQSMRLTLDQLISIYMAAFTRAEPSNLLDLLLSALREQSRDFYISTPFSLNLTHIPGKSGENQVFRKAVKGALADFKTRHSMLFPLTTPVRAIIIHIPPRDGGIDLDNLARKLIPLVLEILAPPTTSISQLDVEDITDGARKVFLQGLLRRMEGFPKHSVASLEILEVPRLAKDPPEGSVRFIFCDALDFENCWGRIDAAIDKWKEHLD